MVQVGDGVEIPLKGNADGVRKAAAEATGAVDKIITKAANLKAALNDVTITSKLTNTQLAALQKEAATAAAKVDALGKTTTGGAEAAKQLGTAGLKVNAALTGLTQAAGGASGGVGQLLTGASGLAMAFAQGGPLLAGMAALGVVMSVVNAKMEEQAKRAQVLEDKYKTLTAAGIAARDKATASTGNARIDLQVAQAKTGNAGSDAVMEKQLRISLELARVHADIVAKQKELATYSRVVTGLTKEENETRQNTILTLRAQLPVLAQTKKAMEEEFNLAPQIAEWTEKAAMAAERKAKAEQAAAAALDRQVNALLASLAARNVDIGLGDEPITSAERDVINASGFDNQAQVDFAQRGQFASSPGAVSMSAPMIAGVDTTELKRSVAAVASTIDPLAAEFKKLDEAAAAAAAAEFAKVDNAVASGIDAAGAAVGGDASGMIALLGGVIGAAFGAPEIGASIGRLLGPLLSGMEPVASLFLDVADGLGTLVNLGLGPLLACLEPLGPALEFLLAAIGALIGSALKPLLPIFTILVGIVATVINAIALVVVVLGPVVELFALLLAFGGPFLGILNALISAFSGHSLGSAMAGITAAVDIAATKIIEAAVWLNNGIVNMMRSINQAVLDVTLGVLDMGMGEFGNVLTVEDLMHEEEQPVEPVTDPLVGPVTDLNTTMKEFNRSLQNLPTGYKVGLEEYDSQNARTAASGGVYYVYANERQSVRDILSDVQRYARKGQHTGRNGNSRSSIPDWRN